MNRAKWSPERIALMATEYQKGKSRQDLLAALMVLPGDPVNGNDIGTYIHEAKLTMSPEARKEQQREAGRRGAAAFIARNAAAAIASGAAISIASPAARETPEPVRLAYTRDGTVSIAALVEAQEDRDNAAVATTARDAAMWGARNGVASMKLSDINARRKEFQLPGFFLVPERGRGG